MKSLPTYLYSVFSSYVAKNVPYYYAKVSPYVDPVMEKTGNYSRIAYNAIYTHSEPIRTLFNTHFPPLLEKVSTDILLHQIGIFLSLSYKQNTTSTNG